jgi:hypothetical protein
MADKHLTPKITFHLPKELDALVREKAEKECVKLTELVIDALWFYLANTPDE